ncbi:uncharacterized protein LOC108106302 [Drosophila eugracilis]|uniref:uncharacterized protein LOC108106302 n=1 Tax=Drosophila eugracilis TaxID=29029 RepID=UPI0007E665B1|nr:uncharacterized protein LOC108106302 [Drosophila eugracilis]
MSSVVLQLVKFLWLPLIVCSATNDKSGLQQCTDLLNTQKLVSCCGKSFLDKFLFIGSNCTPYWDNYGPCRYECLYNHWNILDKENKIRKPELYLMITTLYSPLNGYDKYGTALKAAHETCEALGSRHADFLLLYSNQLTEEIGMDSSTCLPYAMLHAQCTTVYLTADCPPENWRGDEDCDSLKKTLSTCTKKLDEKTDDMEAREMAKQSGCNLDSEGFQLVVSSILTIIISRLLSD